jgi:hypothetical protein
MQFLIRVCLQALVFMYVIPMIGGISFHGNFIQAIGMALFFSIMLWVVEVVAVALSAYLAVATLGVALLALIPAWLLGFWILPAVAIKWIADFMPGFLSVHGWVPAIFAGLILLFVSMVTGSLESINRGFNRQVTV